MIVCPKAFDNLTPVSKTYLLYSQWQFSILFTEKGQVKQVSMMYIPDKKSKQSVLDINLNKSQELILNCETEH